MDAEIWTDIVWLAGFVMTIFGLVWLGLQRRFGVAAAAFGVWLVVIWVQYLALEASDDGVYSTGASIVTAVVSALIGVGILVVAKRPGYRYDYSSPDRASIRSPEETELEVLQDIRHRVERLQDSVQPPREEPGLFQQIIDDFRGDD